MINDPDKILVESVKRLLRRDATTRLRKIVKKTHAADLSLVFHSLSIPNQGRLFNLIDDIEIKGEVFSNVGEDTVLNLIEDLNLDDVVEILDLMPKDDVADLLGRLPVEKSDVILEMMKKEGSEEVEGLLHYGDDTAGGIMVPDFIALREDTTARAAIESLQEEHLDVEMPFYLYVVDANGKLIGVSSLRQLVVVPPNTPLKDFMTTDVFAVKTDMDQEEVAKIVARYDILAVPVVDDTNQLVGIVTVDDVIDIIREEATEDILKMAGAGGDFVETKSIFKNIKMRMPWLFASCVGGIIASFIIGYFQESLSKLAYLAAFIPVIMGMGGNIGVQSATITVRGLATGRLNIRDIWSVVSKQLMVGLILGLLYGTVVGLVAQLKYSRELFALSVGIAVLCSMTMAALAGSLVPMTLAKINIDPAIASGPFVTTAIDIISVTLYFIIATTLLGI
ncbi:MAG: magnesium transporter [Deltaproteobacteria bacterium]|nr:magnesium transporter [Deltaproteobacteria bacterium]MDX2496963.1 magnesium transporter [Desulfobacterales bacterium]MBW1747475.1 magnesium transporter [Deltaproteobacteria bacterium]MBW1826111.1 magnesium transporter [Deltaproteobacteria bacterium]MBW1968425.1 magnesium transporter [Deltaproteobacteria bacterium]